MKQQRYDVIDFAKLIAALLVVAIHTDPFYEFSPQLHAFISGGVARLAVPFFFIATAFFFFSKQREEKGYLKRFCKRLAILYLCWFILLLPVTVFNRFVVSPDPFGKTLARFLHDSVFSASFSGSWYLTSCIFCAVFFSCVVDKIHSRIGLILIYLLFGLIYLLAALCSTYSSALDAMGLRSAYQIVEKVFCAPYFNLFTGLPYFALGKQIAERTAKLEKTEARKTAVITCVCFGLFCAEIAIVHHFHLGSPINSFLLQAPVLFFGFSFLLQEGKEFRLNKQMREASTIIYLSQFAWILFVELLEYLTRGTFPYTLKYVLVLALCFATYYLIKWLKQPPAHYA